MIGMSSLFKCLETLHCLRLSRRVSKKKVEAGNHGLKVVAVAHSSELPQTKRPDGWLPW